MSSEEDMSVMNINMYLLSRERAGTIALAYTEGEFNQAKLSDHCMILAQEDDSPHDHEFTVIGEEENVGDDSEGQDERGEWGANFDSDDLELSSQDETTEEQEAYFITPSFSPSE